MIEFKHVDVKYENRNRLSDFSLNIQPGEFVYLLGPSGAGKSTLLKLLYMDIKPHSGEVRIGEFFTSQTHRKDIPYLRRQLGVVFQDFRLLQDRTVYENLSFVLMVTQTPKKDIPKKVMSALAQVGLSSKQNKRPNELSGGEQQRVVIARALVNKPLVILADEPTGNLDPDTSNEIMKILLKINQTGTAIIMATHDYNLVNIFPQRVIKLDNGILVSDNI